MADRVVFILFWVESKIRDFNMAKRKSKKKEREKTAIVQGQGVSSDFHSSENSREHNRILQTGMQE